jgi:uncharacterized protein (TIGR04255 family)
MGFPESKRVIYRKNPLAEVALQLRFPTILKIDSGSPADFQDAIRSVYPEYSQAPVAPPLPANVPPQIINLMQGMGMRSGPARHLFETEDRKWQIALTRETLELRTTAYQRWEEFRERMERARSAFEGIYGPSAYTRLGLRYVDVIRRSLLGLKDVAWSELLKPHIAGELSAPELANGADSLSHHLHCRLEGDDCYLTLRTGIALAEPNNEKCFLMDLDFHTHGRTEIPNVPSVLDTFNRKSGRLFRWSIQQRLHEALEPESGD